ncbi:MAG: hypothetical protein ACUZ8H_10320 [Candidatus Anammoxibacter sp.]
MKKLWYLDKTDLKISKDEVNEAIGIFKEYLKWKRGDLGFKNPIHPNDFCWAINLAAIKLESLIREE